MLTQLLHWVVGAISFVLHFDKHLELFIQNYGSWTYAILAGIVFCETGLVVTPFLPGDSLLFAVGAFAARGSLSLTAALVFLALAAVLGDAVNYAIGFALGPKALESRMVKQEYSERTHKFFERYGNKTILLARFVPIIRTFAPFLAGVGRMSYRRFATYNVIGGVLWVGLCLMAGFLFGNMEIVKKNFSLVVLAIIAVSLVPAIVEAWRARTAKPAPVATRKRSRAH